MKLLMTGLLTLTALSSLPAFARPTVKATKATRQEIAQRQLLADLRLRGSAIPAMLTGNGRGGR